jgi:hypothetical protein
MNQALYAHMNNKRKMKKKVLYLLHFTYKVADSLVLQMRKGDLE